MAESLTGETIASTYKTLLKAGTTSSGVVALASDNSDSERVVFGEDDAADVRTDLYLARNRVGIGIATPDEKLHIQGAGEVRLEVESTDGIASLRLNADTDEGESGSSIIYFDSEASNGSNHEGSIVYAHNGTNTAQKMHFKGADDQVTIMTLEGSGQVGIGTTSPSSYLHISATDTGDSGTSPHALHIEQEGGAEAGDTLVRLDFNADPDVSAGGNLAKYISFHDSDNDEIGYIGAATATTMTTTIVGSDVRLKTDIKDTSLNGLSIINAIKIRDFKWGDKAAKGRIGKQVIGKFVADEVYEVFPNASWGKPGQMKDIKDKDGNKTGEEIFPMGVSEGEFIAPMMKAIQELSAKVEALENA